jgi:hypothetical protein
MVMKIAGEIKGASSLIGWDRSYGTYTSYTTYTTYTTYRTYTTYVIRLAERPNQFPEGRNGFGKLWRKSVAAAKPETIPVSVTAGRKNLAGRDCDPVTIERLFC